jgi:hypothetical protein
VEWSGVEWSGVEWSGVGGGGDGCWLWWRWRWYHAPPLCPLSAARRSRSVLFPFSKERTFPRRSFSFFQRTNVPAAFFFLFPKNERSQECAGGSVPLVPWCRGTTGGTTARHPKPLPNHHPPSLPPHTHNYQPSPLPHSPLRACDHQPWHQQLLFMQRLCTGPACVRMGICSRARQ